MTTNQHMYKPTVSTTIDHDEKIEDASLQIK